MASLTTTLPIVTSWQPSVLANDLNAPVTALKRCKLAGHLPQLVFIAPSFRSPCLSKPYLPNACIWPLLSFSQLTLLYPRAPTLLLALFCPYSTNRSLEWHTYLHSFTLLNIPFPPPPLCHSPSLSISLLPQPFTLCLSSQSPSPSSSSFSLSLSLHPQLRDNAQVLCSHPF